MKLFIFVFTLMISAAQASETVVMEFERPVFEYISTTAKFDINRDMGRAWVKALSVSGNTRPGERYETETRGKVEGLSFDNATNSIVWNGTVCATVQVRGRGPFRYNKITNTGCKLTVKEIIKSVDNGYIIRKIPYIQVILSTL